MSLHLTGRLADRDAWSADACSIGRTLGTAVGVRSSILILREAFYGTTRFDDFASRVGISEPVAATRLRDLVDEGLLERRPYREPGQRTRSEYLLTDKGTDLLPALIALMQWGDRWLAPDGGAVELRHRGCGAPVAAELRCADDHRVESEDVDVALAPRRRRDQPAHTEDRTAD